MDSDSSTTDCSSVASELSPAPSKNRKRDRKKKKRSKDKEDSKRSKDREDSKSKSKHKHKRKKSARDKVGASVAVDERAAPAPRVAKSIQSSLAGPSTSEGDLGGGSTDLKANLKAILAAQTAKTAK